jgi:Rhs element Vgr protein
MAEKPESTINQLPGFTFKIEGTEVAADYVVISVHVWKHLNKIARAEIKIIGGDNYLHEFKESEAAQFAPGKAVEISLGFNQQHSTVFKGIILRHGLSIKRGFQQYASKSMLILECADKAISMTVGHKYALFEKSADSKILTGLITGAGLNKDVDTTAFTHPVMAQYDETDWDFMLRRARANGMVVINSDGKVAVKKLSAAASDDVELEYGTNIISFEGEIDAASQFKDVKGISWDPYKTEKVNAASAEPPGANPAGNINGATLAKVTGNISWELRYPPLNASNELKALADGILAYARLQRIRGQVEFRGISSLIPGQIITLKGLGSRFNGKVYVSGVDHFLENGNFITRASFGMPRYPDGETPFSGPDILTNPVHGIHLGTVKKIDGDPDAELRIQVQIPGLFDDKELIWARLTQFFSGKNAGSLFVPEVGSEVAIGFIRNDPRFPVVLGSLYNKTMQPYTPFSADNAKKAILSTQKITLEFDDKDKVMTLKTPGGNKVILSDKDKGITIQDQHGNKIVTSASGIEIKSAGDINISSSKKVNIKATAGADIAASGGDVNVKGLNINAKAQIKFSGNGAAQAELTASGQVTVKGGIVMIN